MYIFVYKQWYEGNNINNYGNVLVTYFSPQRKSLKALVQLFNATYIEANKGQMCPKQK